MKKWLRTYYLFLAAIILSSYATALFAAVGPEEAAPDELLARIQHYDWQGNLIEMSQRTGNRWFIDQLDPTLSRHFLWFKRSVRTQNIPRKNRVILHRSGYNLLSQQRIFKIHFQVRAEKLIPFLNDLIAVLMQRPELADINTFKVVKTYRQGEVLPYADNPTRAYQQIPTVVLYIPEFYTPDIQERNAILDPIVMALYEKFRNKVEEYALPLAPRFSYRINPLIYIAGGDGDAKERDAGEEVEARESGRNFESDYTPDKAFVKGFEYIPPMHRR